MEKSKIVLFLEIRGFFDELQLVKRDLLEMGEWYKKLV